jgi:hypothetical protein
MVWFGGTSPESIAAAAAAEEDGEEGCERRDVAVFGPDNSSRGVRDVGFPF